MKLYLILFTFLVCYQAQAQNPEDITNAKEAHQNAIKANKQNEEFRKYDFIRTVKEKIDTAVESGEFSVIIQVPRELLTHFKSLVQRLQSLGFTVTEKRVYVDCICYIVSW